MALSKLQADISQRTPSIICMEEDRRVMRISTESSFPGSIGVLFEDGTLQEFHEKIDNPQVSYNIRVPASDVTYFAIWGMGVLIRPSPNPLAHTYYESNAPITHHLVPSITDVPDCPRVASGAAVAYSRQSKTFLIYSSDSIGRRSPTVMPIWEIRHPQDSIGEVVDFILDGWRLYVLRRAPPLPTWQGRLCSHEVLHEPSLLDIWGCNGDGDLLPIINQQSALLRLRDPALEEIGVAPFIVYKKKGPSGIVVDPIARDGAPHGFFKFKQLDSGATQVYLSDCDTISCCVLREERPSQKQFASTGHSYVCVEDGFDLIQISFGGQ